ncbi:MAG: energy transducer TonB [Bacteroidales bacterium]|nr:energy transducer TonB [Bacteroidales bacterium]
MKKLRGEDKAGLYFTVIFHLVVIIVLLVVQIGYALRKENSFVLDFSRQEEIERQQHEQVFKEDISRRIEDLIAASEAGSLPVRNVAVDRSSLKDDRGTDAEQLYKDAERLQQELEGGVERAADEDDYVAPPDNPKKDDTKKTDEPYKGPSVVSYSLDGRKASHLSIPAYRCMGGGLVTVIITVDNAGNVVNAKVQEDVSSADACLRNFAVRAARLSKFSKSTTAPARQTGDIVYQFIPQ